MKVSYEQFSMNPAAILSDPNLVIRIDDQYYNWQSAAPFIISMLAFKQPVTGIQPLVVVQR